MHVITDANEEILATYNLCLIGPKRSDLWTTGTLAPLLLRETEENLTDLLPEGYSVRITEWNEEE